MKNRLARELLIGLSCCGGMLLLFPPLVALAYHLGHDTRLATVGAAYWYVFFALFAGRSPLWQQNGALQWQSVTPDGRLFLWALLLSPYALCQLVRSILWAGNALHALRASLKRI